MTKAIYFDMDGTIANFYGVDGWLQDLINQNTRPYKEAKVLVNMNSLARVLNRLQRNGYEIGIISWLSKSGTQEYNEAVANVKSGDTLMITGFGQAGSPRHLLRELASTDVKDLHTISDDLGVTEHGFDQTISFTLEVAE